jgi:amidase
MNFSEYLRYDGLGLAELVAQKQIHPAELLQIAIERSQQTHSALNAIIIPMHDYAKNRAERHEMDVSKICPFIAQSCV